MGRKKTSAYLGLRIPLHIEYHLNRIVDTLGITKSTLIRSIIMAMVTAMESAECREQGECKMWIHVINTKNGKEGLGSIEW